MTAIKRKIVIARPGTYKYDWGEETKTYEDLKEALSYSPTIKLTLGHPEGGRTRRRDFLGFAKPKANDNLQLIEGEAWFYQEHFSKIPEKIRQKIINYEPWKISPGFTYDDESVIGAPKGTFFDHVAILREEENPRCPLDKCGVNVRLEAESMPRMIYEKESTTGNEETDAKATETETTEPEASSELGALRIEVAELKTLILSLKEPPSVPEPEVIEEKPPEEPEVLTVDEPKPEPETVVPAGTPPKKGMKFTDQGFLEIVHQPKKSK